MQDWKSKEDLSPKWESVDDSAVAAVMKSLSEGTSSIRVARAKS